jgi:hypothetical protein
MMPSMRYFTRGWASGELEDAACERLKDAYYQRLRDIEGQLPEDARRLARGVNLHDAVIETIRWHPTAKVLTLAVVTVDVDSTYQSVVLTYAGAMLGRQRVETLREVARDRTALILYDEVDLDDGTGLLAHRLLFDPRDELTIDFQDLKLSINPRTDPRVLLGPGLLEEDDDR